MSKCCKFCNNLDYSKCYGCNTKVCSNCKEECCNETCVESDKRARQNLIKIKQYFNERKNNTILIFKYLCFTPKEAKTIINFVLRESKATHTIIIEQKFISEKIYLEIRKCLKVGRISNLEKIILSATENKNFNKERIVQIKSKIEKYLLKNKRIKNEKFMLLLIQKRIKQYLPKNIVYKMIFEELTKLHYKDIVIKKNNKIIAKIQQQIEREEERLEENLQRRMNIQNKLQQLQSKKRKYIEINY